MTTSDALDKRVRELHDARFKDFEEEVRSQTALVERNAKRQKERIERRRQFMESIGTDMKKLDAAIKDDNREQEAQLKAFLEEFRPKSAGRHPVGAAAARDAAVRSQVLA